MSILEGKPFASDRFVKTVSGGKVPVASIWAQTADGFLGSGKDLLWRVPDDFAHFKSATMNSPIIMGRSSWDALGRPLPGRTSIVVTRDLGLVLDGAEVVHSIGEALLCGQKDAALRGSERVWVTGGAQIYSSAMDVVDELVVSILELKEEAQGRVSSCTSGVYAPEIDPATWQLDTEASDAQWRGASGDALRWRIQVFRRI
mgnify:FL=1